MENAGRLGVDLSRLDAVVLSHGHYDHGGGLGPLFQVFADNPPPLYAGLGFKEPRFSRSKGMLKEIGLSSLLLTPGLPPPITVDEIEMILPSIYLLPAAERVDGSEANERFIKMRDGKETRDEFDDEIALALLAGDGLIVVSGCAHRGIANIARAALGAFPGRSLKAIVGGFHLVDSSIEEAEATASEIAALAPQRVFCSHCTGLDGYVALSRMMGKAVSWLSCGQVVEL